MLVFILSCSLLRNYYLGQGLSLGRANSVVAYLVNKGIEANRLSAKGFGPANPVASNTAIDGRAKNRRVEMKVID